MSADKHLMIPAGAMLTITTGAYSDYSVEGVFRALADIHADDLVARWLTDHPQQRSPHHFDEDAFMAWVAKLGLVEPVPSFEWHLSNYADAAEMWVRVPDPNDGDAALGGPKPDVFVNCEWWPKEPKP